MAGCRSEFEKYNKCREEKKACEQQFNTLEKCRAGLFFNVRTTSSGAVMRPTPNIEINANGVNVIFHENEHMVFGSQGVELRRWV